MVLRRRDFALLLSGVLIGAGTSAAGSAQNISTVIDRSSFVSLGGLDPAPTPQVPRPPRQRVRFMEVPPCSGEFWIRLAWLRACLTGE